MCIIVVKQGGYNIPSKDTLKTCFNNNSDGAGFMYTKNDKVIIDKGYLTFNKFYDRIEKLKKEIDTKTTPIVFHFRIGTSGAMDGSTTHPFELTNDIEKLTKLKNKCDIAIAHNGIIRSYEDTTTTLNDTQLFIKDFLYPLYKLNKNFYFKKDIQDIILKNTNSKFAILNSKGDIVTIGDFIERDGILYSNYTFEDYKTRYDAYYSTKWDDLFEDDFESYTDFENLKEADFKEFVEKLQPLLDDEFAIADDGEIYDNTLLDDGQFFMIDYYDRLYLINFEAEDIEKISDYVEIYDNKYLTQVTET